ncbi:MAG: right-handed parallel beta-helix repeat-containing protein, partial [bacterium]
PAPYDPARRYPFIVLRGEGIDPIAVCDTIVDFDRQRIGSRTVRNLWIKNRGRSRLDLSDVNVQGLGFDARIVNSRVNPADSGRVDITFIPNFPESYERAMSIRSNDRTLFITLKGRGFGPKMVLTDTLRFLGYAYYGGDTLRGEIPIRNSGDQDLIIDSVRVDSIVGPIGAFTSEIPSDGLTVPPDSTGYLMVRFHPPLPNQDYEARLYIYSNYPLVLTYRVKGRGMALPGRYVFGEVSGVWESLPGGTSYIVLDSAVVPLEGRLRIMPGAVVRFEPGAFLRAIGQIRAIGTVTDSIFFLPRDTSGTPQARWRGIEIRGENNSRITYCVIRGSQEGLRIHQSSPIIQYSTISLNGDSSQLGGGIFCSNSGAVIAGSRITGNFAHQGGGFYILNSKVKVFNCLIEGNSALRGGAVVIGFLSAPLFQSNIVVRNFSEEGSIVIKESSTPWWVNNTIADNSGGAFRIASQSIPTILNAIIYANGGSSFTIDPTANALVSYSFVEGGFQGTGNISSPNPQFDHSSLPYALNDEDTAFIDHGNPERSHRDFSFPPSKGTSRNDIGAYGGPLGGGWKSPEIAISVLQNPAFSRWINLIVTSQEPFLHPPLCSLEFGEEPMRSLAIRFIDSLTYGARYEVPGSGPILITAEADIGAGVRQKVSRDFQVIVTAPGEGGYTPLSNGVGGIYLPESIRERTVILSMEREPIPPKGEFLFLTLPLQIWGVAYGGEAPAQWKIPKTELAFSREGYIWKLFRQKDQTWEIVPTVADQEALTALLTQDGTYAWGIMRAEALPAPPPIPNTIGISSYPNPFNRSAIITFYLHEPEEVELKVYSLKGDVIKTLSLGHKPEGSHRAMWDGTSDRGEVMPSGIYVIQLKTAHQTTSYKMILMR